MKRNAIFKSQMVGFYFTINDCPYLADVEQEAFSRASRIHHQAYHLLEKTLPRQSFWSMPDDSDPELQHCLFELCEESHEYEAHGELMAFSFWLFSYQTVSLETLRAMLSAVKDAYIVSAAVLGGVVKLARVETQVKEEVVTYGIIDLAGVEEAPKPDNDQN